MDYFFPIQVRFADTDAQGHVFFGTYFTYFDEAVSGLLRSLGFSYAALRAQGLDLVYAHAKCDYIAGAVFEDLLHVYARVTRIGETSLTIECEARRVADNQVIARGSLVNVMIDNTGAKTRVPDALRHAVAHANHAVPESFKEPSA